MSHGKVKWFNNAKGFGFVIDDNGGDDLFVHYSYINSEGYKTLKTGQRVRFDVQEAPNGRHAIQVELIDDQLEKVESTQYPVTDCNANITPQKLMAAEPIPLYLGDAKY